jgi:indolepyruvate ferredoxin oxidoreductase
MGINQGPISLDQKYTQGSGHVFLTGIQALVPLNNTTSNSSLP